MPIHGPPVSGARTGSCVALHGAEGGGAVRLRNHLPGVLRGVPIGLARIRVGGFHGKRRGFHRTAAAAAAAAAGGLFFERKPRRRPLFRRRKPARHVRQAPVPTPVPSATFPRRAGHRLRFFEGGFGFLGGGGFGEGGRFRRFLRFFLHCRRRCIDREQRRNAVPAQRVLGFFVFVEGLRGRKNGSTHKAKKHFFRSPARNLRCADPERGHARRTTLTPSVSLHDIEKSRGRGRGDSLRLFRLTAWETNLGPGGSQGRVRPQAPLALVGACLVVVARRRGRRGGAAKFRQSRVTACRRGELRRRSAQRSCALVRAIYRTSQELLRVTT